MEINNGDNFEEFYGDEEFLQEPEPIPEMGEEEEGEGEGKPKTGRKKKERGEKKGDPLKDIVCKIMDGILVDRFVDERDGEPYAVLNLMVVTREGKQINVPKAFCIYDKQFRALVREIVGNKLNGVVLGKGILSDAMEHIADMTLMKKKKQMWMRIGYREEEREGNLRVYWDLANKHNEIIQINKKGWGVANDSPLVFYQPRYAKEIITPIKEKRSVGQRREILNMLWELVNVREEEKILFLTWLTSCFYPVGTFPILVINGDAGSAKSTATLMIKRLIDPSLIMTRTRPKDMESVMVYAHGSYILAYDNISAIDNEFSDLLCGLACGTAAYGKRKNYSDKEESVISAKRPIVLNGISQLVMRGDLGSRSLVLDLPMIEEFRGEREMEKMFQEYSPAIMGVIMDIVVEGLRNVGEVGSEGLPRLVDFARWGIASEEAMGFERGSFMEIYNENISGVETAIIEGSPLVLLLKDYMESDSNGCSMLIKNIENQKAGEILTKLENYYREKNNDKFGKMPKWFPESPRYFGDGMRRMRQILKKQGYWVTEKTQHNNTYWTIRKVEEGEEVVERTKEPNEDDLDENLL